MIRFFTLVATFTGLQLVDPALSGFAGSLPLGIQPATLIRFFKWGLALWTTVELNAVLNRWAENRWTWKNDKNDWNWPSEVAVVTGGSAGIGACVVKKLVSHGIKVAVLDIGPLSEAFSNGVQ